MSETFDGFVEKCEKAFALKSEIKALEMQAKPIQEELDKLEREIVNELEERKLTSFDSRSGKLIKTVRTSVKIPQGDDKFAFFEYLKANGHFEALATVNSAQLNKWYKEELELAQKEKKMLVIPGLGLPSSSVGLSFRNK